MMTSAEQIKSLDERAREARNAKRLDHDWQEEARCVTFDPELFFPVGISERARDQTRMAKRVCDMCDVKNQCLQYALDNNEDSGVWGGLSEDERRLLKRRGSRG
jgi:WhiB family redox-sensing transcriptional regulator